MRDDVAPPDCVAIQHCAWVDAYVAAWQWSAPQSRRRIQSPLDPDRALYHCDTINGRRIADVEVLIDGLWTAYRDVILKDPKGTVFAGTGYEP